MVNIISNEDLIDHISEYDAILVGANIYAHMNGGFAFDVKRQYPYVHEANINTRYGDITRMGTILEVTHDNNPTFCLCYIVEHISTRPDIKKTNLDYESLEKCLNLINILYKGKHIASPLLGASQFDGNGDKEKIIQIFKSAFKDVDIDIYDYEQDTICQKWRKAYKIGAKLKKTASKKEYEQYIIKSKQKLTKGESNT